MNFFYSYTTGPGKFSMHVADETGKIIWQSIHPAFITDTLTGALIPDDTPMELGMLKNLDDISGLERHLKYSRLMEPDDTLIAKPIVEYLAQYTNEEEGMQSVVTKGAKGFHVSLKDLDSNQWVGAAIIYPDFERADKKAKEIVGIDGNFAKGGILTYEPNPHLTAEQNEIETKFGKQISENYQAEKERYLKKFGHVINTDNARELSPDYLKNKEELSSAVHEPASAFVKMLYADLLEEKPESNYVLFTAGGTGAGKTTAINEIPELKFIADNADVVYDSNMNKFPSANKKINQALQSGRRVHIIYVYRDAIEAFVNGVIPRAKRVHRTVPIYEHVNTHFGSLKTMAEIQENFRDNPLVKLRIVDNSFGKNKSEESTLANIDKKQYLSEDEVKKELYVINENKKKSGKITQAEYNGFKGNQTFEQGGIPEPDYGSTSRLHSKGVRKSSKHSVGTRQKQLAKGGKLTPAKKEKLIKEVAKQYEGKKVEPKYQEKYGKRYSEKDAKSVAYAIANTVEKIKKQKGSPTKKKGYGSLLSGY